MRISHYKCEFRIAMRNSHWISKFASSIQIRIVYTKLVMPGTVKDWVSGKLISALPKRLVQQLLTSLIENRNMVDTIDFRETKTKNMSEFTLVMYTNIKAREKHRKSSLKNGIRTIGEQS